MDDPVKQSVGAYDNSVAAYIAATKSLDVLGDFEKQTALVPGSLVLDAGCAYGRDVWRLVDRGFSAVGIDLSDKLLEEARKRVPSAEFYNKDVRKISFSDNSFDTVLCNAVLMLMPKSDARLALAEFYRVLKPKGQLLLSVKEGEGEGFVTDRRSGLPKYCSKFLIGELEEYAAGTGFDVTHSWIHNDLRGDKIKWASIVGRK